MQPTQHAFATAAVVVLNKLVIGASGFVKSFLIEAFKKKPRASPNTLGSMIRTSATEVEVTFN
jgi:hypothetical protein